MTQTTLFKKNRLLGDFKGLKPGVVVGLWIALVVIGLFLFCSEVLGAVIEDFETYELGDLTPQSDWAPCVSGEFTVTDDRAFSYFQSVKAKNSGSNYLCNDTYFESSTEGSIAFYMWTREGADPDVCASWTLNLSFTGTYRQLGFKNTPHICDLNYLGGGGGEGGAEVWNYYGLLPIDTWNKFTIQWKLEGSNLIGRYQINDAEWTDWLLAHRGIDYPTINTIFLGLFDISGEDSWIDFIRTDVVCAIGSCKNCGSWRKCEEAGCFWYVSIYQPGGLWSGKTGGWCVEPYEPEAEECGALWKCQYCMTQETCEAEYCEWVDRYGLGEKCYLGEPTIPPEQVEWEVPDLEECGELSGVELWLCEIKNFGAGIFMPSQAKVNDLYYTIGAFKDRFPFSYVEALNRFFTDIETSLDEEKGIPITILGQESEVDFTFWDKTTTIGGEEETFKNILFDFTSLLIIFGWFMWLISIIRRFF